MLFRSGQRAVERDKVRFCEQLIHRGPSKTPLYLCIFGMRCAGEHAHAEGRGKFRHPLADSAEADDAERFPRKLCQIGPPKAKVRAICPFPCMDGPIMGGYAVAERQDKREYELRYRISAVGRNIGYRDAALLGIAAVDHIVAGGEQLNKPAIWKLL